MSNNTDPVRALAERLFEALDDAVTANIKSGGEFKAHAIRALEAAIASAPPSAPVGVEAIREAFDEISGLCRHLRQGGPAPEDLQDLSDALDEAVGIAANMLHALAQQPAAPSGEAVAWLRMKPDGTPDWAEDCIGSDDQFLDPEMASDGYYLQPLYAAPQQPAAVDEAMVERALAAYLRRQEDGESLYGCVTAALTAAIAAQQQGGAA